MNILFISIGDLADIGSPGLYTDLIREFVSHGHEVCVLCSRERRTGLPTALGTESGARVLRQRTLNIKKTGTLEKGLAMLSIGPLFRWAVRKYFGGIRFSLVIYSTPPVTLVNVVKHIKRRDMARTYLLLKDIFPQNAVDIGMLSTAGVKGILYRYFRRKEKKLYAHSDWIGCMSPANIRYLLSRNPLVPPEKAEVCPNSIHIRDLILPPAEKRAVREQYGLPQDKIIFVYGGSLGRPQDVPFIIRCLQSQRASDHAFFLVMGSGTAYDLLKQYVTEEKPPNVKLMASLPREEYDAMIASCDVGMIFLDHRFTVPNFPSRLLSYMQAGLPVLACTDPRTDIGEVITEGQFGWRCESDDVSKFSRLCDEIIADGDLQEKGHKALAALKELYPVCRSYDVIMSHFGGQGS